MLKDSMMTWNEPAEKVDQTSQERQEELNDQVEAYLAKGKTIEMLPNNLGASKEYAFNRGPVMDPMTGHVLSRPSREVVNGRSLVRIPAMQMMTGMSSTALRTLSAKPSSDFPRAVKGVKPMAWCELEVQDWIKRNDD